MFSSQGWIGRWNRSATQIAVPLFFLLELRLLLNLGKKREGSTPTALTKLIKKFLVNSS
ncbi:hypothetical protein CWATWH0005_4753 [Crocosphaera watsonii WH 0005]|uniref:Uncharacterized protein n=1 Tax=Crocosphaera watsonii WH 0005 TaxID=423472 RepID=T2ING4_CROWT|nr:hypothetical protein CWATWH0005_4753 [Crocosphaera watsonii WH 0005]